MAHNHPTQDILALFEKDTYVLKDTDQHLLLELADQRFVYGQTLDTMIKLFCNGRATSVKCSVDLDNGMIHVKEGSFTLADTVKPAKIDLDAVTESERALKDIAKNLGIVDYDDLRPEFELCNSESNTVLTIGGLLHVSHDALRCRVQDTPSLVVRYDMQCKSVHFLLPRMAKRKR